MNMTFTLDYNEVKKVMVEYLKASGISIDPKDTRVEFTTTRSGKKEGYLTIVVGMESNTDPFKDMKDNVVFPDADSYQFVEESVDVPTFADLEMEEVKEEYINSIKDENYGI